HLVTSYLVDGGEKLFGALMFAFVLTNLPINIYLLRKIMFTPTGMLPYIRLLYYLLFLVHTAIFALLMLPISWASTRLHEPKRWLSKAQLVNTHSKLLWHRLKVDDLFGRLVSGPKISIYMGPSNPITFKTTLEVLSLSLAYHLNCIFI